MTLREQSPVEGQLFDLGLDENGDYVGKISFMSDRDARAAGALVFRRVQLIPAPGDARAPHPVNENRMESR